MKKLLSSLVVLLLLVSCCLIAAFPTSATDINYDDFDIIDGVLIEYLGAGGDVVIPSVDADGNPITHIDSRAFWKNTSVTSVVISEGIETMGSEVFEFCENLTEVSLPYSLTETGYSVFRYCNLYALTIPGNLKILNHDFSVGGPITDFVISSGVEELDRECVYGQFTELVLPESVYMVRGIFRGGMSVEVKEWRLYVLNPDCELGIIDGKDKFFEEYGSVGPLTYGYDGCKCKIAVYGLKDSSIKEYVNTYMKDKMGTVTARFVGMDQDEIDELEQKNEERSITKPTVDPNTNKEPEGEEGGNNNNNTNTGNNNNGAATNNGGSDSTLLIVVIIAAIVVILIIAVVVVVVVLSNSKKKKKKKKKAKKAVEAVLDEATESVAEETTEEKGEEE